ncbi:MAG: HNH endonuclease signature motif containing protein [Planctomycetota bacterium]
MPGTTQEAPLRLQRAREITEHLRTLVVRYRKHEAEIAQALVTVKRERLYALLGYASLSAYALGEGLVRSKSKVSDLVSIIEGSEDLEDIRESYLAGELCYSKARELVKFATPETQGELLQLAPHRTSDELRAMATGKPPKRRRTLSLTPEESAEFDQLLAALRKELGRALTDSEAVLELIRRGSDSRGGEAPRTRLVVSLCPGCEVATSESREGSVPVPAAAVAAARCNGEVHDLRDEDNQVTRAIPARVRRRVLDRDRQRCRVPGCPSLYGLELHHEDGWVRGHDPERIVTLCDAHHRVRHEGALRIEALGKGEFRFSLLDGTELGASTLGSRPCIARELAGTSVGIPPEEFAYANGGSGAEEFAYANGGSGAEEFASRERRVGSGAGRANGSGAGGGGTNVAQQGPVAVAAQDAVEGDEVDGATRGLVRLGVPAAEARYAVAVAFAAGARSVGDLLTSALAGWARHG